MVSQKGLIGCLLLVVVALWKGATAETYKVGDDLGWTIPPAGSVAYSTWANAKRFQIGDTIEFKWSGEHRVAEVTQADYDSCSKDNPLGFYDSSPTRIVLTSNLTRYLICTEDSHCSRLGQKVTIRIGGDYSSSGDNDDDDHWWEWNGASSLSINIVAVILCTALVISFLSFN
ncbi:hypothetical protein ACFX1R_027722 [Malus domestica]|uniref:umecyanin-like n=1 Tax=Malus domestica TaxID=3750 RepID=UPI0010AA102F|nr:umecyanin-like [Malus domestica]